MFYPITLTPDENGTVIAKVPDVPGVMTIGADEREAKEMALDALLTMIAYLIIERKPVSLPSKAPGLDPYIELPPLVVAKVAIHNAMIDQEVTQVALAERLKTDPKAIRRLLDIDHKSKWEQLEAALRELGFVIHARVERAEWLPTFHAA